MNTIQSTVDAATARIAFSLGAQLVRDRVGAQNAEKLSQTIKIKIFDAGMGIDSGEVHQIIEKLGVKIDIVPPHTLSMQLDTLPTDQIVVATGIVFNLPLDIVAALQNFAQRGGRILFANCSPNAIAIMFPGKFQGFLPTCTVKAPLRIIADKDLFTGFAADERKITPELVRYPLREDNDHRGAIKVLAKFESYYGDEPTLSKFEYGDGVIYILVSKMFLVEKKELPNVEDYLKKKSASEITVAAWQCANKVGYKRALSLAMSASPFIELVCKLILKESAAGAQFSSSEEHNNNNNAELKKENS